MVRRSRDHYRPILHLRHFTDVAGMLWAYDRSNATLAFRQIAPNVGFEKGLYTIVEPPDGDPGAFETWLADRIDGPAAQLLDKAAHGRSLTRADRSILARFIGAQDLRTPRAKDRILAMFGVGLSKQWEEWRAKPHELAAAIAQDSGRQYTPDEIRALLAEYQLEVTANAWLDFFQDMLNKVAERLFGMRWLRAYTPAGTPFVTSDVGIVKCCQRPNAFASWDMGFAGGRDIWVFPVKPEVAIVLTPPGGPGITGPCRADWARAVNRHMWDDAYRWVFSREALPPDGPPA